MDVFECILNCALCICGTEVDIHVHVISFALIVYPYCSSWLVIAYEPQSGSRSLSFALLLLMLHVASRIQTERANTFE